MSENKWTPGSWTTKPSGAELPYTSVGDWLVTSANGLIVATVIHDDPPDAEPNAHLIAAAPSLYEALECAEIYIDRLPTQNQLAFEVVMKTIRDALSLARGEAK